VGEIATANVELENTSVDIPKVFGAGSPEDEQLIADPDSFKDPETADYVGVAVHCARGSAFCSDATAVKYGQSAPSHAAVADVLPDEPGGYTGYQALFGHKYLAPQLGAGKPDLTRDGYEVTNPAGNLVDLNGNEIDGGPGRVLQPGVRHVLQAAGGRGHHAGQHAVHAQLRRGRPRGRRQRGPGGAAHAVLLATRNSRTSTAGSPALRRSATAWPTGSRTSSTPPRTGMFPCPAPAASCATARRSSARRSGWRDR
jgi:hypothetical protein